MEAIAKIVGIMMMSRTYTHMAHLKTGSYAKHMALEVFYETIVDKMDQIAEAAQGKFGKLDIPYVQIKGDVEDPIGGLESQLMMITNAGKQIKEPFLDNIVQEIQACYSRTLYRLRELD
jgi:hypothetical protein